jgi:methylated-DNA-[protein]-cysteine S-methyltransferase
LAINNRNTLLLPDIIDGRPVSRGVAPSPIGDILVSEREGAIVAVSWAAAAGSARDRGPASPLVAEALAQLGAYFAGASMEFDLPLNPGGSEFQNAVWRAMRDIPAGAVRTYGELARAIGSSARAVGGACGANPIPIIIPCHRVVAAQGLGGYSGAGGVETKRTLLTHEGALAKFSGLANHRTRV